MNNALSRSQSVRRLVSTLMLLLLAAAVFSTTEAHALRYRYRQLPPTGTSNGALLLDKAGNLYGTTPEYGAFQAGSVFELVRTDTYWSSRTLYSFCSKPNCKDGAGGDYGKLVMDTKGNLYGLTTGRSTDVPGTAYELMPSKDGSSWKIKILHTFCGWNDGNCKDGLYPVGTLTYAGASSGAPYDGISPLYGTTKGGGQFGLGTAFLLTPPAGKGRWTESVLYSFCMQTNCTDGSQPVEVTSDARGNLFGTTASGGAQNGGTAFELSADSDTGIWTEHTIASFYGQPSSGLTFDPSGNAYGVTLHGGSGYCNNPNKTGCGSLYELHLNADGNYDLRYLVAFCHDKRCNGGAYPSGDLTLDAAGNLYGMATGDFFGDYGAAFALIKTEFNSLYSFCPNFDCNNASPAPGLTMDPEGNFFGVVRGVGYELFHK